MYTIIYEHNKRSQILIYSKIWVSNPKILCSQMLVFTLNLDSRKEKCTIYHGGKDIISPSTKIVAPIKG